MGVYNANWEDEEHNRIVELSVEYLLDDDQLQLVNVTPLTVNFVDPQSRVSHRTLRVHTESGRQVLRNAHLRKGGIERLEQELRSSLQANA